MKKVIAVGTIIILISTFTYGKTLRIEAKASYFYPSDEMFKEIYGKGYIYGGEISIKIWKSINVWIESSYYTNKGKLTLTKENTEITIFPVFGGLKFVSSGKSSKGYLALGLGNFLYKEKSPICEINKNDLGYIGQLGIILKVFGAFVFDFFLSYSYCEVMPQNVKANLGGIQGGIGLGFEF